MISKVTLRTSFEDKTVKLKMGPFQTHTMIPGLKVWRTVSILTVTAAKDTRTFTAPGSGRFILSRGKQPNRTSSLYAFEVRV